MSKIPRKREVIRNDSSVSEEEVLFRADIEIKYGDKATIMVEMGALKHCIMQAMRRTRRQLREMRPKVEDSIEAFLEKTAKTGGKFTKQEADDFYGDMMIWRVLNMIDAGDIKLTREGDKVLLWVRGMPERTKH